METVVKLRHVKQSARKVRFVLNELRGKKVDFALELGTEVGSILKKKSKNSYKR